MQKFCQLKPSLSNNVICWERLSNAIDSCNNQNNLYTTSANILTRLFGMNSDLKHFRDSNGLNIETCQQLMYEISREYLVIQQNNFRNHLLFLTLIITIITGMIIFLIKYLIDYQQMVNAKRNSEKIVKSCISKSLQVYKYEHNHLHVSHIVQPNDYVTPNGLPLLVLRAKHQKIFIENLLTIVNASKTTFDKDEGKIVAYKSIKHIRKPVMHVSIIFEDDDEDDDDDDDDRKNVDDIHDCDDHNNKVIIVEEENRDTHIGHDDNFDRKDDDGKDENLNVKDENGNQENLESDKTNEIVLPTVEPIHEISETNETDIACLPESQDHLVKQPEQQSQQAPVQPKQDHQKPLQNPSPHGRLMRQNTLPTSPITSNRRLPRLMTMLDGNGWHNRSFRQGSTSSKKSSPPTKRWV